MVPPRPDVSAMRREAAQLTITSMRLSLLSRNTELVEQRSPGIPLISRVYAFTA